MAIPSLQNEIKELKERILARARQRVKAVSALRDHQLDCAKQFGLRTETILETIQFEWQISQIDLQMQDALEGLASLKITYESLKGALTERKAVARAQQGHMNAAKEAASVENQALFNNVLLTDLGCHGGSARVEDAGSTAGSTCRACM